MQWEIGGGFDGCNVRMSNLRRHLLKVRLLHSKGSALAILPISGTSGTHRAHPNAAAAAPGAAPMYDLGALGWGDDLATAWRPYADECQQPARISRVDRSGFDLFGADGPIRATPSGGVLAAVAANSQNAPCVGDWAVVRSWSDGRITLEALLPRRAVVVRAAAGRQSQGQVLVANHDVAMVVEPLHPEPDLGRIERLLALAWQSGAQPCVVLTKADLVPDAAEVRADVERVAPGVDVHVVSSTTGDGVDDVRAYFEVGRTIAMLGPSGAGKSTLTNALAGAVIMATRALRADGKGRHTTVHRELVVLPNGGIVIDTPGLRVVGLFQAEEGLELVFGDVEALAAQCRFNDCGHSTEPGCAVLGAIESGDLDSRRLDSWRKLQREMLRMAMRSDARLRQAELGRWKQITKELRHDAESRRKH